MKNRYNKTIVACFIGYIVQAIINNFVPLLFLTFEKTYEVPLSQITLLITINFGIQLLVDILSVGFIDKIGYRASMVIAHIFSTVGLILITILPEVTSHPFIGILISVVIYAIGGGLLEVLVSPVVESCPSNNKETAMSMLHSFYCWGHVGVVAISTLFFYLFGINNWKILSIIWAIIPLCNTYVFTKVPMTSLLPEGESGLQMKDLFKMKLFWILFIMIASAALSKCGTTMFALLALGGDIGCSGGPTLVGMISSSQNDNLKIGILVSIIFPIILLLGILLCKRMKTNNQ